MTAATDTIAAIATPPGVGGVGIVRVSGPQATAIAHAITGIHPRPRHAHFVRFRDAEGETLDQGVLLHFKAPASFTGEDVVEFHGHGGPVVMNLLLRRTLEAGARAARPGEFSERAFLNDKLDLAQAEAIADLIAAGTETAVRAAQRSLEGDFSAAVQAYVQQVVALRVYVEAAIDFPDEEVDFLSEGGVEDRLQDLADQLGQLRNQAHQGRVLRDGLSIALVGRPNAGKSSLLNALAGTDAAIVTDIPGTTRDLLREQIQIDGIPIHLVDTAGLRDTVDAVEAEGVRRARKALADADLVLLVVDDTEAEPPLFAELVDRANVTRVHNKIDLSGRTAGIETEDDGTVIYLSAQSGAGMELLREHIRQAAGMETSGEGAFMARTRHLEALRRAADHLEGALEQLRDHQAGELVAEELRQVQQQLDQITGEFTSDDLLGAIFSSFCIGK